MSQTPIPIVVQFELWRDSGGSPELESPYGVIRLSDIERAVDALGGELCHGFGVVVRHAEVHVYPSRVTLVVDLEAGEWRERRKVTTSRLLGWQARWRARILRFVRSCNESLG